MGVWSKRAATQSLDGGSCCEGCESVLDLIRLEMKDLGEDSDWSNLGNDTMAHDFSIDEIQVRDSRSMIISNEVERKCLGGRAVRVAVARRSGAEERGVVLYLHRLLPVYVMLIVLNFVIAFVYSYFSVGGIVVSLAVAGLSLLVATYGLFISSVGALADKSADANLSLGRFFHATSSWASSRGAKSAMKSEYPGDPGSRLLASNPASDVAVDPGSH